MLTLRKTTLGDHNRGICGSRNNCRFNGSTVCWAIDHPEFEGLVAVRRKKDAELIVSTINEKEPDWDAPNSFCPIDKAISLLDATEVAWRLGEVKGV